MSYKDNRIYWTDIYRDITTNFYKTCLRSCNLDGSDIQEIIYNTTLDLTTLTESGLDYYSVGNRTSDLVIDIYHNNTAFFMDTVSWFISLLFIHILFND
jgi:hypothetical protein